MKFYYVYILQSVPVASWIYVGYTENLKKRFAEHNNGESISTKSRKPFHLIHYEAYATKADAKRRELYLKTTKGKTTLRTMLQEYFDLT
jgi:putative endonuclease